MKIDLAGEKSVLVELSKEDMTEFNITYDDLDYSNVPTRKVLFCIMEKIRLETGKTIGQTDKLKIDVMPDSKGGCLMIFTDCAGEELVVKKEDLAFICEDINNLIDCARALKKSGLACPETSLYSSTDGYILTTSNCNNLQKKLISEFAKCERVSILDLERIREYGECIKSGNALEVLCGKIS